MFDELHAVLQQLRDDLTAELYNPGKGDAETPRHRDHASLARSLWVDVVCINQEDAAEKSQQVKLMRDIYAKAAEVLV